MRANKYAAAAVAISLGFQNTIAAAQSCSHIAGDPWFDNYGYRWGLEQNAVRQVSGYVVPTNSCGTWEVTGNMLGAGWVSLKAENPNPGDWERCTDWFRYFGRVQQPGCNMEAGTWLNSWWNAGAQYMHKTCETPSGERTRSYAWMPSSPWRTMHVFSATLLGGVGPNFGGRTLVENTVPGSGEDTCWYVGSPFQPIVGLGPWEGALFGPLNNTNLYLDGIGLREDVVAHYQIMGAPCQISFGQAMSITCEIHNVGYKINTPIMRVEVDEVTSSRDGVSATSAWPPP